MRHRPAQTIASLAPHRDPARTALLIDFDGTLVDITATPDAVCVPGDTRALIASAAQALEGRLAIVSGRSLAQLDALLGDAASTVVIAASHGQELRADGRLDAPEPSDLFARLAFAAQLRFEHCGGIVIEEKSFGLGIHYRLAPGEAQSVGEWTEAAAARHRLTVQRGDMVCELRPRGADKGDAVRAIMALPRFAGATPIYIGDDLTDIPAFEAARALGGRGLAVGPRTAAYADEMLRDTAEVATRIRKIVA